MRLSEIPEFSNILQGKLPYAEVNKFISACIRYDAPTPEVAQTLVELLNSTQDQVALDALKIIAEKMFGSNDIFEMATGHLQMTYIDDLYLGSRQYETDWEITVIQSIREIGLLNPIFALIVSDSMVKLRVWDGVLRVRAYHLLGYKRIPAYVFPKDAKLTRTLHNV